MKILVTGSEGFIGKTLCAALEKEHELICYDNKLGSNRELDSYWIEEEEFDLCYHLACVNQEVAVNNPDENLFTNAHGAWHMAKIAKEHNAKIVYTSTATHQTLDNPYCGVVAKFIDAAENGEKMKIYGTGHQTRDFTYVDDVVKALIRAGDLWDGRTLNISHSKEVSINSLALEVQFACGNAVPSFSTVPRPIDGIQRRWLKSDVFCPVDLAQGLAKTVSWVRSSRDGKLSHA